MRTSQPFTMYLGGEGGTGKTRAINSLLYLAEKWGFPGAFRTCAPTGIAASLVRGQTFHSLIELRAGSASKLSKKPSQKSIYDLVGVLMIIVDAVSMLNRKYAGAPSLHLQKVRECPDKDFGGVIIIFARDFFLIPPVRSDSVYCTVQFHVGGGSA